MKAWAPLIAVLFGCTPTANLINEADTAQLIQTTLSDGLATAKEGEHKVCVQRELALPLHDTKDLWKQAGSHARDELQWWADGKRLDAKREGPLNQALEAAVMGRGLDMPISKISSVPAPIILFSERQTPKECDTASWSERAPHVDSFSRPVFAEGYAFIETSETCGMMCGGSLKAFEKRDDRWVYVATMPTYVV